MGRKATGLKRPIQVPGFWNAEEHEYLVRKSLKTRLSKAELMRRGVLKPGWRNELAALRIEQKAGLVPSRRSTDWK